MDFCNFIANNNKIFLYIRFDFDYNITVVMFIRAFI